MRQSRHSAQGEGELIVEGGWSGVETAQAGEMRRALDLVQAWVERHDYRGYEPFDGLSSWVRPLLFGNLFAERLLMQGIRQSPFNLRPLFGVRPQDSTKGRGYMASGYLALHKATGEQHYLDKATRCLEWLDRHKSPRFHHHCWSNHFDFSSRSGSYTKHDPIIVWTSLIGQAYVEAFEITGNAWFLRTAESACNWILELPRNRTDRGDCLSYMASAPHWIHNANMLGACLLARTAKHTGNKEYRRVARAAIEYTCLRQLPDGAWLYAEEPKYHWIDNFHTGYNLDSLYFYMEGTGDHDFVTHLDKGMEFYKANFFDDNGRPKYYHTRTYPVDIQCAAQSIDTLALLSARDPSSLELAGKVAAWTIRNMQDRKGYFYYRQYPCVKAKIAMLHWGQATTFKALAHLFGRLASRDTTRRLPAYSAPA
jgi:rhamnogalacturonyl hydrolase YesR